jgi:hypothetical protein
MRVIIVFLASLCAIVTPVTAVHGGRVLGQPISEDVERRLKKMNTERRKALSGHRRLAPVPGFRRLSEAAPILSRPSSRRSNRKLPYYTGTIKGSLSNEFAVISKCNISLVDRFNLFFCR